MVVTEAIFWALRVMSRKQEQLILENVALRQQIGVPQGGGRRLRVGKRDRVFWVWLSKLWEGWRSGLVIVQPETVLKWHRQGFKVYWRWRSKSGKAGGPQIDLEIRQLIRQMSRENAGGGLISAYSWGR